MLWIVLILNLATALISARKRVLPYAVLSAIFTVLVVGQAFQMQADFQESSTLSYAYSTISQTGYHRLCGISLPSASCLSQCV